MKAVDFLEEVWGDEEAFVDLPAKTNGQWVGAIIRWPANGAVARRIRSSVRDGEDLYFSPATFKRARRDAEEVRPTHWLWADLDEVEPNVLDGYGLRPTSCWCSSPGRYQALWRLTRKLSPQVHETLNRALTYTIGADLGGWDLTQVLRVPGTYNHKYQVNGEAPRVRLLWHDGPEYDPKVLYKQLKKLGRAVQPGPGTDSTHPRKGRTRSSKIPARAKRLLQTPPDRVVQGERSARLWELECLLLEAGFTEDEVFDLVEPCAWNKWASVRSGSRRLKAEIKKAAAHVDGRRTREAPPEATDSESEPFTVIEPKPSGLPFENYANFMAKELPTPSWLIQDIWTTHSQGFVAGEPKASKSTITLAAALSIASGKPFLGEFKVFGQGPVLIVQEENDPSDVQDKLRKIAHHLGLIRKGREITVGRAPRGSLGHKVVHLDLPDDVPLAILNNWGFDMADPEHREALESEIDKMRPALVVLDPLYLMVGTASMRNEQEITPYLKWLTALRFEYNCAIQVVHHYKKLQQGGVSSGGQRLMGSATFHGWLAAALYSEALEENRASYLRLRVSREFRAMPPQQPLEISIKMGKPGSLVFEPTVRGYDLSEEVVSIVEQDPGITASRLCELLGVDKRTALARARGSGKLRVERGKRGRGYSHRVFPAGYEGEENE